jgi:hypothetical protein
MEASGPLLSVERIGSAAPGAPMDHALFPILWRQEIVR